MLHTEPRDYYVSMRNGKRTSLLAGPFPTHIEALATVETAYKLACKLDAWADFYTRGTCSLPRYPWNPKGKLNSRLGLDTQPGHSFSFIKD